MVELRSAPTTPIRYTVDGADPKISGITYDARFIVQPGTVCVLAVAEKNGITSDQHRRDIKWDAPGKTTAEINAEAPALWKRSHHPSTTKESYEFLARLKKFQTEAEGVRVTISGQNWLELSVDERLKLAGETLEGTINHLRGLLSEGEVEIEVESLRFLTGQLLLNWVADAKVSLNLDEVVQTRMDS